MMPFAMHNFDNLAICGKRGGFPFLVAKRPDFTTGKCPDGYFPCSDFTSLENTICYNYASEKRTEVCPITSFSLNKEATGAAATTGAAANPIWTSTKFGDYTFKFSRDVDSMPATIIKVDEQPCADPTY